MNFALICIITISVLAFTLTMLATLTVIVASINNDYDDPHDIPLPKGPRSKK